MIGTLKISVNLRVPKDANQTVPGSPHQLLQVPLLHRQCNKDDADKLAAYVQQHNPGIPVISQWKPAL